MLGLDELFMRLRTHDRQQEHMNLPDLGLIEENFSKSYTKAHNLIILLNFLLLIFRNLPTIIYQINLRIKPLKELSFRFIRSMDIMQYIITSDTHRLKIIKH